MMSGTLTSEATLAAIALVRQAVDASVPPLVPGDPAEVVNPYLEKAEKQYGADVNDAMRELLMCFGQFAGSAFQQVLAESAGVQPSKEELLAALENYEARWVMEP